MSESPVPFTEAPSDSLRSPAPPKAQGLVYTFYSYKGGVGRSMALANTAVLLARSGQKVLMVDWDLEAPGIERFFESRWLSLSRSRQETPGIVDLIRNVKESARLSWHDCLIEITQQSKPLGGTLSLITAGKLSEAEADDYVQRLRGIEWGSLFGDYRLGERIEEWRSQWAHAFDVVLIDSRTGISDIGNICTILFPDVLILVFTTSSQSIDGIADVMRRSRAAQAGLPVDRGRLAAVPLLSRDERERESDLAVGWRNRIAGSLGEFYRDWLPPQVTAEDVLQKLYIPQIAYWSFGERLPVVEREEEMADARSMASAYIRLARLIQHQLDWTKIEGDEGAFAEIVKRAEEERLKAEQQRLLAELAARRAEEFQRSREAEAKETAGRYFRYRIWAYANLALFSVSFIGAFLPIMLPQHLVPLHRFAMSFAAVAGSAFSEIQASLFERPDDDIVLHERQRSIYRSFVSHFFAGFVLQGLSQPNESDSIRLFPVAFLSGMGVNLFFKSFLSRIS